MKQLDRRRFLNLSAGFAAAWTLGCKAKRPPVSRQKPGRPNILLITADDMNYNTPDCFGGPVPGVTPNIDRLASEGIRFEHAHVTISICMPSREALMTGRYPLRFCEKGGFQPVFEDVPVLQESLHQAGYINGIFGKVNNLRPGRKFHWSMTRSFSELGCGRDAGIYYQSCKEFFELASSEQKPFFLMVNSHDPHRPFHGSQQEQRIYNRKWKKKGIKMEDIPAPSRVYKPEEVVVPEFIPGIPTVRKETAQYYSSARRCDDTAGATLRALEESGMAGNTLVMFLSDNGMSMPYSKANCYLNSTKTPWIVRWPGQIQPGSVDDRHFISGIDYMPTILEAAGLPQPPGMDGRSFLPLLYGQRQRGREHVFTVFHETSHPRVFPMRCVQDEDFGYIFNAWSDGQTRYDSEGMSGLTMQAMREASSENPDIAGRVEFYTYRTPEELYNLSKDPNALHNLAGDPEYQTELDRKRRMMLQWLENKNDPLLQQYRKHLKQQEKNRNR